MKIEQKKNLEKILPTLTQEELYGRYKDIQQTISELVVNLLSYVSEDTFKELEYLAMLKIERDMIEEIVFGRIMTREGTGVE